MKKNLLKITVLAIVGLFFISSSFAQPAKKDNMKHKKPSHENFVLGEFPQFDEISGTVKVEGKGENQKVYVVTDKKEKILVEVTGGPKFGDKEKSSKDKKNFNKDNRPEMPKDFEKGKRPELPEGFDKDKMPTPPEGFEKDKHPEMPKDFEKGKRPEMPEDFEKGKFGMPKNFSPAEDLAKLKGKKVTLVGKYNSDKTIFNVVGIVNK